MRFLKYFLGILFCSIAIAIGHAFVCLPVAISKTHEFGNPDNWFSAWVFCVFIFGLPRLFVIEIPMALCVYLIAFGTNYCNIDARLKQIYFGSLLLCLAFGGLELISTSSKILGLIEFFRVLVYFAVIIETARLCKKVFRGI
jgi:hypothetical protein